MATSFLGERFSPKLSLIGVSGAASPHAMSRAQSGEVDGHVSGGGQQPRHSFFFNAESRAQRHGFVSELGLLSTFSGEGVSGAQLRRGLSGLEGPQDSAASHLTEALQTSAVAYQLPPAALRSNSGPTAESTRGQRTPRRPTRLLLNNDQKAFSSPLEEIAAGVEG